MLDYSELGIVVLAAGKGTRMKSDLAKVLHRIYSKSMIYHVLNAIVPFSGARICVVIGYQAQAVKNEVSLHFVTDFAFQKQLLGTGDAVKTAIPNIPDTVNHVMVLCGDVPLIRTRTLRQLVDQHIQGYQTVSMLTMDMTDPTGYGRIILDKGGNVLRIVEEKDTADRQKMITKVNSGIYCFEKTALIKALNLIQPDNHQHEFYLTDTIEIIGQLGGKIGYVTAHDSREVIGVNTVEELKNAESVMLSMKNELP